MLIALAGLPASGKSTLAARLAEKMRGVVLDKDQVRAVLFPQSVLDYSAAENEISMGAIYAAAGYIRKAFPSCPIILDGRTFLRARQIHDLFTASASLNETPRLLECVCSEEIARARLEKDRAAGLHPAKDRTFVLYSAVKSEAVPITVPHLVLDTGALSLEECVERSLRYLNGECDQT